MKNFKLYSNKFDNLKHKYSRKNSGIALKLPLFSIFKILKLVELNKKVFQYLNLIVKINSQKLRSLAISTQVEL